MGTNVFKLITENVFKCVYSIKEFESLVTDFAENLLCPIQMRCCIIIINAVNKLKKTKMPKDVKNAAEMYKTVICDKVLKLCSKNKPAPCLTSGYALALRNFISQNEEEKLSKLLNSLNSYVDFALEGTTKCESGDLMLIVTLLQNKSKLKSLSDDFLQRVWNAYKENEGIHSRYEEYSLLIVLIFGHIPNEEFTTVTTDLLSITVKSVNVGDLVLFGKHLKTWESVLSCDLNPTKMKILSDVLERLLQKIISLLQSSTYDRELYESIFQFEKTIVQTVHLFLSPPIMDLLILSITLLMLKEDQDFKNIFNFSMTLLECLLRYRKPLIMDRLPPYLQQYRILLRSLCRRSNSDLNLEDTDISHNSDCAHQLEKLTNNLIFCQKDMGRIAMYLVADILEQYEQVTLYPNVKIHLNNCIYSLISICDQHAVAYLMRVLSSASTEIFKIMYENYKKYYRFTGKV
ncbi:hypothetical protein NQ314_016519 [Rhamnusium bicolor]|uniref:Nucleolar 27S pre-rRNA processing Urb2/Npa2 C-terminal domain-containing protein n=1 Tax=Rhamnusium bicolor TaxID=1586634 RepID=A0AAV8WWV1_9CUCU|nr:hypothetical protein NQ314_016519 [Rhamnusium bicolor]